MGGIPAGEGGGESVLTEPRLHSALCRSHEGLASNFTQTRPALPRVISGSPGKLYNLFMYLSMSKTHLKGMELFIPQGEMRPIEQTPQEKQHGVLCKAVIQSEGVVLETSSESGAGRGP